MPNLDRFVDPTQAPHRIALSAGDWIEIKPELNVGDQKKLENAGLGTPVLLAGHVYQPIDWTVYEIHRAHIWLLDWSFRTPDDKPMPLSLAAIVRLKPKSFQEITDAIRDYVAACEAAEKKGAAPATTDRPSSGASTTAASPSTGTD